MYTIPSKTVQKRRTEYKMVTTNNTSQCICGKKVDTLQGLNYCIDSTYRDTEHGLVLYFTLYIGILDFMISDYTIMITTTGSEYHMITSNCSPNELFLNLLIHLKNKEETHLSDLRAVFTFRASPRAFAAASDISLLRTLRRRHKCAFLT